MKKIYLPTEVVRFVNNDSKDHIVFNIPRQMTKREIKNYFETVYKTPISKIRTLQSDGKMKRASRRFPYRTNRCKKAMLIFER